MFRYRLVNAMLAIFGLVLVVRDLVLGPKAAWALVNGQWWIMSVTLFSSSRSASAPIISSRAILPTSAFPVTRSGCSSRSAVRRGPHRLADQRGPAGAHGSRWCRPPARRALPVTGTLERRVVLDKDPDWYIFRPERPLDLGGGPRALFLMKLDADTDAVRGKQVRADGASGSSPANPASVMNEWNGAVYAPACACMPTSSNSPLERTRPHVRPVGDGWSRPFLTGSPACHSLQLHVRPYHYPIMPSQKRSSLCWACCCPPSHTMPWPRCPATRCTARSSGSGFMQNYQGAFPQRCGCFIITSQVGTSGVVTVPLQGQVYSFTVGPFSSTFVDLPVPLVMNFGSEAASDRGVHVVADDPISVVRSTARPTLPMRPWSCHWTSWGPSIMSRPIPVWRALPVWCPNCCWYPRPHRPKSKSPPSVLTAGGHPTGQPFTVTLNTARTLSGAGGIEHR